MERKTFKVKKEDRLEIIEKWNLKYRNGHWKGKVVHLKEKHFDAC